MHEVAIAFWCLLLTYFIIFLFCAYIINLTYADCPEIVLDEEAEQIDDFMRVYKNCNPNITTTDKEQPTTLSTIVNIDVRCWYIYYHLHFIAKLGQVQLDWKLNIFKTNFLGDSRTLDVNCSVEPIVVFDLELLLFNVISFI